MQLSDPQIKFVHVRVEGIRGVPRRINGQPSIPYVTVGIGSIEHSTPVLTRKTFTPFDCIVAVTQKQLDEEGCILVQLMDHHKYRRNTASGSFSMPLGNIVANVYAQPMHIPVNLSNLNALKKKIAESGAGTMMSASKEALKERGLKGLLSVGTRIEEKRKANLDDTTAVLISAKMVTMHESMAVAGNPIGTVSLKIVAVNFLKKSTLLAGAKEQKLSVYCVVQYLNMWHKLRTVRNAGTTALWDDDLSFEVRDLSSLLQIAVVNERGFFNATRSDTPVGLVRMRLSNFHPNRTYIASAYPLYALRGGKVVEKMGDISFCITVNLTAPILTVLRSLTLPPRLKEFYSEEASVFLPEAIAAKRRAIIDQCERMSISEEVVELLLFDDTPPIQTRILKINKLRLKEAAAPFIAFVGTVRGIMRWHNPRVSFTANVVWVFLMFNNFYILPTIYLGLATALGLQALKHKLTRVIPLLPETEYLELPVLAGQPEGVAAAEADGEESDEEHLDPEDSKQSNEHLSALRRAEKRLEELKGVATTLQNLIGSVASNLEKFWALVMWEDPVASLTVFMCLAVAGIMCLVLPQAVLTSLGGMFVMRHPRLRNPVPPAIASFFGRLSTRRDRMMVVT